MIILWSVNSNSPILTCLSPYFTIGHILSSRALSSLIWMFLLINSQILDLHWHLVTPAPLTNVTLHFVHIFLCSNPFWIVIFARFLIPCIFYFDFNMIVFWKKKILIYKTTHHLLFIYKMRSLRFDIAICKETIGSMIGLSICIVWALWKWSQSIGPFSLLFFVFFFKSAYPFLWCCCLSLSLFLADEDMSRMVSL